MKNRDIRWFYQPGADETDLDIFNLPLYVELYFNLFRQEFEGATETEKRMSCLIYLLSDAKGEMNVFDSISADRYILSILDAPFETPHSTVNGLYLSNFHWHYYRTHASSLSAQGVSIDRDNPRRFLAWFYTWGAFAIKGLYVQTTLKRILVASTKYHLPNFELTVLFELLIDDYFDNNPTSALNLIEVVSFLILNYDGKRYSLTERQISQLVTNGQPTDFLKKLLTFNLTATNSPWHLWDIHPKVSEKLITG